MDAANGAATATISNGGTPVAPTDRTAVDTLVGRNITDHTAPDATALRECHFGEQQHPRQRCEQAGEKSALVGHGAIIATRRGEKEGPDGRSGNAGKPTTSTPEPQFAESSRNLRCGGPKATRRCGILRRLGRRQ
jgi:hypothetical protein